MFDGKQKHAKKKQNYLRLNKAWHTTLLYFGSFNHLYQLILVRTQGLGTAGIQPTVASLRVASPTARVS